MSRVVQTCALRDGKRVRRRECAGCGNQWYTVQECEQTIANPWDALVWNGGVVDRLRDPAEIEENEKI